GPATTSLGIRKWWLRRPYHPIIRTSSYNLLRIPASYDEHDVQHEANGGGGEANLGEQRQAIPCRDVERLKHVDHGNSLSFASNLEKSRPVAAECQGSYVMSMAGDYAMSPRSRRQQSAGRMIDE